MQDVACLINRVEYNVDDKRVQVFSLSDVHVDNVFCFNWLKENCNGSTEANVFSVFIIAGDISHKISLIRDTFAHLKSHYDVVCYVPGNHDLWKKGSEAHSGGTGIRADRAPCSLSKLREILKCAVECELAIGPVRIVTRSRGTLYLYPLYAWYHSGWDTEPSLSHPLYLSSEKIKLRERATFDAMWTDFRSCSWPETIRRGNLPPSILRDETSVAKAFASLNEEFLPHDPEVVHGEVTDSDSVFPEHSPISHCWPSNPRDDPSATVISFSHFLPRQELLPEKKFLLEPMLPRVVGSNFLKEQVQRLRPHLHIFGHSHIPIDITLDSVRYVQWPLGNAQEASLQCKVVRGSGPMLVFDTNFQEEVNETGTSEESVCGCLSPHIPRNSPSSQAHWSVYYREHLRDPLSCDDLAPWLEQKLEAFLTGMCDSTRG